MHDPTQAVWVFGYGSLIWRPDFEFIDSAVARLPGFSRRFWQGSHDHRGLPDFPGRVVTLVEDAAASCTGVAYLVSPAVAKRTFETLDHREKNGYEKHQVNLRLEADRSVRGVVYIGEPNNFAWLGDAPVEDIARQIAVSAGPSGANADYLFDLADALRKIGAHDPHVFELESAVTNLFDGDRA